ncbi:MAG: hypothetical protein HY898_12175 [Deltaproteobacteria bacterium]|nr:hypothetical protein [Deltaproteobacteria bacterium]
MNDCRRLVALLLTFVVCAVCRPLGAQVVSDADRILAQSLFEDGRKLMEAGKYADACPKLAESHRIEPGGGTLLNLATCYEKLGKTATAWSHFKALITSARKDRRPEREAFAVEHINALEPRLSSLTIVVPQAAQRPDLGVKLDGVAISRAAWGSPLPVDPGDHRIEASGPGKQPWSTHVTVLPEGDKKTIEVPLLAPLAAGAVASSSAAPMGSAPQPIDTASAPSRDGEPIDASGRKLAGYVVGGVGVAGIAVGSFFGVRAFSKWSQRNDHCPDARCDAAAADYADQTKSAATVANIGFGLGLVGVGVGTWLVLTSNSSSPTAAAEKQATGPRKASATIQPVVGPAGAGISVGGVW